MTRSPASPARSTAAATSYVGGLAVINGSAFVTVGYADVGTGGTAAGFSGSLNGGGYTLSNLTVNRAGVQMSGSSAAHRGRSAT